MTALLKLNGASKKFGGLVAVNNVTFGVEKANPSD